MSIQKKTLCCAILVGTSMLLAACNDDDRKTSNPPATTPAAETAKIEGVAATGKPFVGKVEVVNAQGKKSSAATINADSTFSVDVPKGAPYLIRAFNNNAAETLYSYAVAAGYANVTQLTTAAMYDAYGVVLGDDSRDDLSEFFASPQTQSFDFEEFEDTLVQKAAVVVANLKSQMLAAGLTAAEVNTLNVFNYEFEATASNKFDNLLDLVKLNYTCGQLACDVTYEVDGQPFPWNYAISTEGININFQGTGVVTGNNCLLTSSYSISFPPAPAVSGQSKTCYLNFPTAAVCGQSNSILSGYLQNIQLPNGAGQVSYDFSPISGNCPAGAIKVDYATGQVSL